MSSEFQKYAEQISKQILTAGVGLRKPSDGSVCSVSFKDVSGTDFSSYFTNPPATISIGYADSLVEQLIEYCISTMLVNEQSRFTLELNRSSVTFVLTLSECFFKPYVFLMADSEKLCLSQTLKEQGSSLFQQNEILKASYKFRRALQYLLVMNVQYPMPVKRESRDALSEDDLTSMRELLINVLNNIALCHLRLSNFHCVIPVCSKSLDVAPNVKGYYRRALAYLHSKEYEKAEKDLLSAHELDKSNKAVLEKLNLVRQIDEPSKEIYKETIKKMFSH